MDCPGPAQSQVCSKTARGALTDSDALDPVCPVTTTKAWNGAGGDRGDFKTQIIRSYRESRRHLSEQNLWKKVVILTSSDVYQILEL